MSVQQTPVQTKASGTGNAQVKFPPIPTGVRRTVVQIAVSNTSIPTNTTQQTSVILNNDLVCATTNAADTADGVPYVEIGAADTLLVVWSGLDNGATAIAVFYYDDKMVAA